MTNKYYPSPSSTTYYVNGILIDDIYRVDFKRNINHQPVYGYNDSRYGFIALGKELVVGNIIINFRYPGYLRAAINNALDTQLVASTSVGRALGDPKSTNVVQEQFKIELEEIDAIQSTTEKMDVIANKLIEHGFFTNSDLLDQLKDQFDKRNLSSVERAPGIFDSPLDGPLDFPNITNFDLSVAYSNSSPDFVYTRIIEGITLAGESEVVSASAGVGNDMSSSAQPILEVYPFFARTIRVVRNFSNTPLSSLGDKY